MEWRLFLKDFFTPSERNNHIPRGLSNRVLMLYLVLTMGIFILSNPSFAPIASIVNLVPFRGGELTALANQARADYGLPTLKENPVLALAAADKARDMFANQYFAHISPQGVSPWEFFKRQNYKFSAAGENLAIDFVTAGDAHRALMNSPTHRANILNNTFTEVGVAVISGVFQNRPSIIVVEFFGSPASASTPADKPAVSPAQSSQRPSDPIINFAPKQVKLPPATPSRPQLKIINALIALLIALPLIFLARGGYLKAGTLVRSGLIIAFFIYLTFSGIKDLSVPKIESGSSALPPAAILK